MTYDHDVIIDRGKVRKRGKAASKQFCKFYWHTPLSATEDIPCGCRRLVIGNSAAGRLPVVEQVRAEARRRFTWRQPRGLASQASGTDSVSAVVTVPACRAWLVTELWRIWTAIGYSGRPG